MKKNFAPLALALLAILFVSSSAFAQDEIVVAADELADAALEAQPDEFNVDSVATASTKTTQSSIARQIKSAKPIARHVHKTAVVRPKHKTTRPIPHRLVPSYLPLYVSNSRDPRDSLVCPCVIPQPEYRGCFARRHYDYPAPYCGAPCATCFDPCVAPVPCAPPCPPRRHCPIRARHCEPCCDPVVYPVAPPVIMPAANVAAPCASCQG